MLQKNPYILQKQKVDTLFRRFYFRDTAVPRESKNGHLVVQLNPDED